MIKVKVPATSANLGPGFDSLGIALKLYNEIEIEETEKGIEIIQEGLYKRTFPPEQNLIYRAMKEVFDKCGHHPSGLKIKIKTNIPPTRGLGSSAACIIGGMVGANAIYGLLGPGDILALASKMENHPDNAVPCLVGGFTVSYFDGDKVTYDKIKVSDEISLLTVYPDERLNTGKSRGTLPKTVSHRDAAYNASHAALLVSAMAKEKYNLLSEAMGDKLHQPYRKKIVPYMEEIFSVYKELGVLGSYLSGSGPTIGAIIKTSEKEKIKKEISQRLEGKELSFDILSFNNSGTFVQKI